MARPDIFRRKHETKRLDAAKSSGKLSALREMMPRPEGKYTPTTESPSRPAATPWRL